MWDVGIYMIVIKRSKLYWSPIIQFSWGLSSFHLVDLFLRRSIKIF